MVKFLGEHTAADVNYNNREGLWNTPVEAACYYDHLEVVKYLVETCHADVNLLDNSYRGYTSLTKACRYVKI